MKNILLKSLLLPALLLSISVDAGLYKGLDDEGKVVYSDQPFENSKKLTPPPLTVMDAPKIPVKVEGASTEEETEAVTKYSKFSIVAPTNNQTIWNEPDLFVKLKITPGLSAKEGHNFWLLLDGKPLVKNTQSLSIPIGRAERGSHKVQAQIRSKAGKILKSSKAITIHIKNSVRPRAAPRAN